MTWEPRLGVCGLCGSGHADSDEDPAELVIYPIDCPHLVACRFWLCEECIQAVCDRGEVEVSERPPAAQEAGPR